MKRYQKQLSFILILAILLTVFTAAPFKVSAASNYLVIYQPEDEQGERIGTIQTENYGDWSEREFNGCTRIMLSVHAEDGYEFVRWDVRVQNGAEKEVKNSPVTVKKGEDTNEENGWVWSLEIEKDSADAGKEYYIREDVPAGYTATYTGNHNWDVVNTKSDSPTEPTQPVTGSYRFTHTDRYGDLRTKTVEVTLNDKEIAGYSGNNNQPGVPTYLWTAEAQKLFDKNPLVKAALAVTDNADDQQDVSVYKNMVEWDLVKTSAADAGNMTPDPSGRSLTVTAKTKPYTFTFNYYFVKDGNKEYKGTRKEIAYGKPVTFEPKYSDPDKYVYINDTIPEDNFCYWSADEEGLIPITTNRTFGMLMRGKWIDQSDTDRVVNVYAQYENHLTEDWKPLIEESTFTHMISDQNDWVYLDYMVNYLSKDGKIVQDMVAEGDQNIRYGLVAVKHPDGTDDPDRDRMINIAKSMIQNDMSSAYIDAGKQSAAYRFEYGKPEDTTKPISNYNRVLYTLRSDTALAENNRFSVIAYITVDGKNYFYSEVNNDINVHELLKE